MIKEGWTLIVFRYTSDDLAPQSHKPVIAACDECGVIREVMKGKYRDMCPKCAHRTSEFRTTLSEVAKNRPPISEETREKLSAASTGEKNPMYGKHHTAESKKKVSVGNFGKIRTMEVRDKMSHNRKGKSHAPLSEETKRKISISNTGRSHTEEWCRNHSAAMTGANHPCWKGGITEWRNQLTKSRLYKAWRTAVYNRDEYTCKMCNDASGGNLQAHHIRPVKDHKNDLLIFDIDNGITLCKLCHESIKGQEYTYIDQFTQIIMHGGT